MIYNTGIYAIYCKVSKKVYIGKTGKIKGFQDRWKQEVRLLNRKLGNTKLQNAWNKYGANAFIFAPLVFISRNNLPDKQFNNLLNQEEILMVKLFDSHKNGYNCTDGGDGTLGIKLSKETIIKMKIAAKKRMNNTKIRDQIRAALSTPEAIARNREIHKNKKLSSKTRELLRQINIGKKQSLETRKKRSLSLIGKNKGPKHSRIMRCWWKQRKKKLKLQKK